MREKGMILDCSPCDVDLYKDGPKTVAEARAKGREYCPNLAECKKWAGSTTGIDCIMMRATQVAQNAINERHSISAEMKDFREFFKDHKPRGFYHSEDRKTFVTITDRADALNKIESSANMILDKEPEPEVGDSFDDVLAHAQDENGAIDLRKMEKLEGRFGTNGGQRCDVRRGPCSCGAWH